MTTYADPEDQIAAEIAAMEAKGIDPYADRVTDAPDDGAPDAAGSGRGGCGHFCG